MISTLKTTDGFIEAYIEWRVVNDLGKMKENGEYIYVADLWIHPSARFKGAIKDLIVLIDQDERSHNAHSVYWTNLKHKERITPTYTKERLLRKVQYGK